MPSVPPLRPVAALVVLAALSAPFVGVAYGAARAVAPLGQAAAGVLLSWVAPLSAAPPAEEPAPEQPAAAEPPALPLATPRKAQGRRVAPPIKPAALFVSQATVLKLADSAARPRGVFVTATAAHPAGLRLSGVGALGIGVQDGDILIEAMGILPRAPGEVIGAVIQARANNARSLSGTLWRRGDTFRITVEQPYLPAKG